MAVLTIDDTISFSDSIAVVLGKQLKLSDIVTFSDAFSRKQVNVSDIISFSDTISVSLGTQLIPTTTLAAEIGHNTSANPAYNRFNFPSNFSGTTWVNSTGTTFGVDSTKYDDSFNPITPCHVSPDDIHSLFPGYSGNIYAHIVPWWRLGGGGGHIDIGVNNDSTAWVNSATTDMQARGFNGIIIDWYGSGRYEDTVTLLLKDRVAAMTGFTYCIMIDHGSYATTADLEAELHYIDATYFGTAGYLANSGNPVVMFFGTVAGVDYAAAKASISTVMYWVFQGPGSLSNAYADGCFDWVQPYSSGVDSSDPYNAAAANSFLTSVHSSAKGSIPCLAPGFNGYLTASVAWSKGKYMPRDSGKCWLSQAAVINANRPTNIIGIQVATWNDWEEGSEIESAIDNGITITTSGTGTIVNWSVAGGTGDETTISTYKLLASTDGINVTVLGTVAKGGTNSFDLNTIFGWGSAAYTIYVVAVGRSCIRNQVNGLLSYTLAGGLTGGGAIGGGAGWTFGARTDLNTVQRPTTPTMGAAGSIVTDPDFGCKIIRATDASTSSGRKMFAGVGGSAVACTWNTDGTMLYVEDDGGGGAILGFNPTTLAVSRIFASWRPIGPFRFSKIDPNIAFLLDGPTINQYDLTNRALSTPPAPSLVVDFSSVLPSTPTWTDFGGAETSDTVFTAAFSVAGGQDTGIYACVYTVGTGIRVLNTQTGVVSGVGITGTITLPDRFIIHTVRSSKDGGWLVLSRTNNGTGGYGTGGYGEGGYGLSTNVLSGTNNSPYMWEIATLNVISIGLVAGFGAWVPGNLELLNNDGNVGLGIPLWAHARRLFSDINNPSRIANPSIDPNSIVLPFGDHMSYNGPANSIFISGTASLGRAVFPTAWYDEILGFALDGSGLVYRFCHTFCSGVSGNFYSDNCIFVSDQLNQFVAFTSDWMGTIGRAADVFIVQLNGNVTVGGGGGGHIIGGGGNEGGSASACTGTTPPSGNPDITYLNTMQSVSAVGQGTVTAPNAFGPLSTGLGTLSAAGNAIPPTAFNYAGFQYFSNATASVNTVVGIKTGENGNNSVGGVLSWYRFAIKFAINGTLVNTRYWMGLGCVNTSSTVGHNNLGILGTTGYASDNPNKTTIGFRYSSGTDTTWKAVVITANGSGGAQTTVDTGVTVDNNVHVFEMATNSDGTLINFLIDHVLVATITSNIPPTVTSNVSDALVTMFWCGDNKNTNTQCNGIFYNMILTIK